MSAPILALMTVGLCLGGVAGAFVAKQGRAHPPTYSPIESNVPAPKGLIVPRAVGSVTINAEITDSAWTSGPIARTGAFGSKPYSDARLVWKDDALYMVLYAADEDLRATDAHHDEPMWLADSYRVAFKRDGHESVIEISPSGELTDMRRDNGGVFDTSWESGAKIAIDRDGTLNDSKDNDEEWVVEMALPLSSIGLTGKVGEHIECSITRCDLSRGSSKRECATWGHEGNEIVLGE
jgi:hypothetical protein